MDPRELGSQQMLIDIEIYLIISFPVDIIKANVIY